MTIAPDEMKMLRDSVHNWAVNESPISAFRRLRDSGSKLGFEPAAWQQMSEMGWAGTIVPETYGGSGLGYRAIGVVLEEMGRTLVASPLIPSAVAAASALIAGGTDEQRRAWLPAIAAGAAIGTLATEEGAHHAPSRVALRAEADGASFILNGEKRFVLEGLSADFMIVSTRTEGTLDAVDGISLFLVRSDQPGVTRRDIRLLDSRGSAHVNFKNVCVGSEALVGTLDNGFGLVEMVLDRARAALCAEMLGAANQAFAITLEYLKTRVQFGQVIGSFQALQHRAALMFCELELSRSAVEAALSTIDEKGEDVPERVSLAKARMGDTLHLVTNEMIQMHGGIGMTDAHDAGFFLKRARSAEALFGNQAMHRNRYARIKGI